MKATPLTADIGVLVEGFDPSRSATAEEAAQLRAWFDRHGLILIRGQEVGPEEQVRFASLFGDVADESFIGQCYGFVSNRRADSATPPESFLPWHTDYGWTPWPESSLSLYGDELTDNLASTHFASSVRALRALSPDLRQQIEGRRGLMLVDLTGYGNVEPMSVTPSVGADGEPAFPSDEHDFPRCWHPLVYRHPRTGEDLLYVNEWYSVLVEGLSFEETSALHRRLFDVIYDPVHTYVHDWQERDLIIWDNLALQHGRPMLRDSPGGVRTLRRVVIHDRYDDVLAFSSKLREFAAVRQAALQ